MFTSIPEHNKTVDVFEDNFKWQCLQLYRLQSSCNDMFGQYDT